MSLRPASDADLGQLLALTRGLCEEDGSTSLKPKAAEGALRGLLPKRVHGMGEQR